MQNKIYTKIFWPISLWLYYLHRISAQALLARITEQESIRVETIVESSNPSRFNLAQSLAIGVNTPYKTIRGRIRANLHPLPRASLHRMDRMEPSKTVARHRKELPIG
jgi:hypothetical protein